jgi:hypothetical protein
MKSSFLVLQGIVGVKLMLAKQFLLFDANVLHVLDGGSLLQQIPWTHGDSFGSIAQMYVDHVIKKYKDPVIVFDSYPELPNSTDDITDFKISPCHIISFLNRSLKRQH